jgi:hypothetical protein
MGFVRTVAALCGSFAAYRQVRDLPLTESLRYLMRLAAALSVVLLASLAPRVWLAAGEFARWVDAHVPEFRIEQGEAVAGMPQPFYAGETNAAGFVFIVDTTGAVTEPARRWAYGILFTRTELLLWARDSETDPAPLRVHATPLRKLPEGTVNGAYFRRLIRMMIGVGLPFALAVVGLVGLLGALVQAYLFSLVAAFMERQIAGGLQFYQLLNLAIHAATPAAVIFTVYLALQLGGLNLLSLVYLAAYGVFLIGATNACRDQPPRDASGDIGP